LCEWGKLYWYIYNLISAFAIKNKMDGVAWTPPVVIDDRQGLHGAKQGGCDDKKINACTIVALLKSIRVWGDNGSINVV
jgi:hypothetical protein